MPTTNFIDQTTVVEASWLNEVDNLVFDIFDQPNITFAIDEFLVGDGTKYAPQTPAQVRTTLGLEAGGAADIWVELAGDTMTGNLLMTNASGPAILNEASSATNPTLVHNRAQLTSGIGGGLNNTNVIANGTEVCNFDEDGDAQMIAAGGAFQGGAVGAFALINVDATATVPNIIPTKNDQDTGLGSSGLDALSIITGGVEVFRLTESGGSITYVVADAANFRTAIGAGTASGQWERISSQSASADTEIDLALPSGYDAFRIRVLDCIFSIDADAMGMRVSNDAGVTFETGSVYRCATHSMADTGGETTDISVGTQTFWELNDPEGLGNAAGEASDFLIDITGARNASRFTHYYSVSSSVRPTNADAKHERSGGYYTVAEDVDAIRLLPLTLGSGSAGNITSGTFILEGLLS